MRVLKTFLSKFNLIKNYSFCMFLFDYLMYFEVFGFMELAWLSANTIL